MQECNIHGTRFVLGSIKFQDNQYLEREREREILKESIREWILLEFLSLW